MKAEKKPHRENPRRGDIAFTNAYCGSRFGKPLVVGTFRVNRAGHALLLCTKRFLPPPAGPVGTGGGALRKGPITRPPEGYWLNGNARTAKHCVMSLRKREQANRRKALVYVKKAPKPWSVTASHARDFKLAPRGENESDYNFRHRVAGELRDMGRLIEAHEAQQDAQYDDETRGGDVLAGVTGALAQALQGVDYHVHGEQQVGCDIAAGMLVKNPKPPMSAEMALLSLALFGGMK